jgi:hypothetical protein
MMTLLLSGCGPQRIVNTDGCAWTKPFVLNEDEFIVFAANVHTMRPLTDDINSHNDARAKNCPAPRHDALPI